MDFGFSEEQRILREEVRGFLEKECPKSLVRKLMSDPKGYSPELWSKMAEMGWMGFIFPEEYGGLGGSFIDFTILMEECGRACLPGPFFSTVVMSGLGILEVGSEKQKEQVLPQIISGDLICTFALNERKADYSETDIWMEAKKDGERYILNGRKTFVLDANISDLMLVVCRTAFNKEEKGRLSLFLVDAHVPGIKINSMRSIDGTNLCEVTFEDVIVDNESLTGEAERGWTYIEKVMPKWLVAKCGEMLGGAKSVLDMTINYAKEREQFGRPIGSFQAIQHYCSDMLTLVEGCNTLTYYAAWEISEGLSAQKSSAIAKAWCSEAFKKVTQLAAQVHGSIGFTEEYDLHIYHKKAKASELFLGDSTFHHRKIAEIGL